MKPKPPSRDPYLVKSVMHSSEVLAAFRSSGEALPLREVVARSGLPKSMAFRLLYTLERCGMIEKVGENLYRSYVRPFRQKPYRLGYAAQGTDYQFSKEISDGLQRAAAAQGIELISVDNRYSPKIAQRNADVLVREKVDLVIEFQTDEHVAPIVAAKYREANIPLIAIEIPHPGATYFGANNYEAGLIGGRYLGRWAKQHWPGEVDEIAMIALQRAGSLPKMRLTGHARRHERGLPAARELPRHLSRRRRQPRSELRGDAQAPAHVEVTPAPGRRDQRSERARRAARVSGSRARRELRGHGTERVAGRARRAARGRHAPHRIGRVLSRRSTAPRSSPSRSTSCTAGPVPPAVFVKHQLVTPETVDHIYPNDRLMQVATR